jgi:hypothetical protein
MTVRSRLLVAPAFLLAFLLLAAPARAEMRWEFFLDGETAGTPSSAWGTAVLVLNDEMTEVAYDIRHFSLQGGETGAHFHDGSPTGVGARLFNLEAGEIKKGVWPLEGRDLQILLGGWVYLVVHSDIYLGGEIRGDATLDTVPAEAVTWSGVKALYR